LFQWFELRLKYHPNLKFDIGGEPFERIVQRDHFSERDAFAVLWYFPSFFGF
jgi:hypothetical protein